MGFLDKVKGTAKQAVNPGGSMKERDKIQKINASGLDGTATVDSMEEVGLNDFTTTRVLGDIARRGVRTFPMLRDVRLVRTWAALRVYSPDGFPIYEQSAAHPGAFVVTCHSGVTLAAAHALRVAPWIAGGPMPDELPAFSARPFMRAAVQISAH